MKNPNMRTSSKGNEHKIEEDLKSKDETKHEDNLKIEDDPKKKKTSWGWAGPSSAQVGIKLYFNFLQIGFLPIWIDKIGLIE